MRSLIFSLMILCLLEIQWIIPASIRQADTNSLLDCSQYANDSDVVSSFPYVVHVNSIFQYPSTTTYALMDKNGHIYHMNIVNQDSVSPMIFCLKHLRKLNIRKTSFCDSDQQLPIEIERFGSSLAHLGIYDTIITHLPDQISKLSRLKSLELSNTGLMCLPNALGDLSSLTHLLLRDNKLTFLPTTMTKLQSIEKITLTNNPHLRSIQALNGLSSLEILHTENCSIKHLPLNLPNLTDLYMSHNNLTDLFGIQTLGSGSNQNKSFYFNNNHIGYISSEISHVNNLYRLNMNHNKLDNLSLAIFNITTLRHFYIGNNSFQDSQLDEIVTKFNKTNPGLQLSYSIKKTYS